MISTFTALIDANVFYGARLRSLMLEMAQTKMFRARWTDEIHEEWIRNLRANRPDIHPEKIAAVRAAMDRSVLDCLVTGYEPLVDGIILPDPDDRHVVAAAIRANASVIVTFNIRDFPDTEMDKFGIHVKTPDDFLMDISSIDTEDFLNAICLDFEHYKSPPLAIKDYAESLVNAGVPETAGLIDKYAFFFE